VQVVTAMKSWLVALASLLWQLLLVSAGAFLRSRATARVRRMTVLAGNAVIAAFGAVLVVHAFA
ncbi:membrane protein, partial [Mycobacterium tuberculosis NRITLD12]